VARRLTYSAVPADRGAAPSLIRYCATRERGADCDGGSGIEGSESLQTIAIQIEEDARRAHMVNVLRVVICLLGLVACNYPSLPARGPDGDSDGGVDGTTGGMASPSFVPANQVDANLVEMVVDGATIIAADTVLDVDSGELTGGVSRPAGSGVMSGIGYVQAPSIAAGAPPLGIFVFHRLTIDAAATVHVTGTRALVLLIGDSGRVDGAIDVAAGRPAAATPGAGGGRGGTASTAAGGCGPGAVGQRGTQVADGGGGGGGAGTEGAVGGASLVTGLPDSAAGGAGGHSCLAAEPLQGGGGGGADGATPGTAGGNAHLSATPAIGGGGGATGGAGGSGGAGASPPTPGVTGTNGGGGGGAVGVIVLRGRVLMNAAMTSPPAAVVQLP
jgi:hypothetical protein